MAPATTLRRNLLLTIAVLFLGTAIIAVVGVWLALPFLKNRWMAALLVPGVAFVDVLFLFFVGSLLLRRSLLAPLDQLIWDVGQIAEGDYRHRISRPTSQELQAVSESVNAMAERLIDDQVQLAQNVRSLEETNRELVLARDQVVLAARLASVGSLSAGLAHEIGNPLGAIMAYLDVVRRRVEEGGEVGELIDSTHAEARRIDRIVRSLLDYARPREESDGPVDCPAIAARVRELLEAQGRLDPFSVEWMIQEDVRPVWGAAQHLEQILVNLLLNALDALEGRPDGRIRIEMTAVEGKGTRVPIHREGDPPGINYAHRRRFQLGKNVVPVDPIFTAEWVLALSVSDNGAGISEDVIDRVFDLFFTTKEPGKGTGIGLAVCARLVQNMGGLIRVSTPEGGGARFLIHLPAWIPDPDGAEDTDDAPLESES